MAMYLKDSSPLYDELEHRFRQLEYATKRRMSFQQKNLFNELSLIESDTLAVRTKSMNTSSIKSGGLMGFM